MVLTKDSFIYIYVEAGVYDCDIFFLRIFNTIEISHNK